MEEFRKKKTLDPFPEGIPRVFGMGPKGRSKGRLRKTFLKGFRKQNYGRVSEGILESL